MSESPATGSKPRHVMVVDDTDVSRMLARAYLELVGCTVSEFESAAEALAHLRSSGAPDAMLIDIEMPVIGGEQLVRIIRAEFGEGLQLVGYTAHCRDEDLARIRTAGFSQVVMKPGSVEEMTQTFGRR